MPQSSREQKEIIRFTGKYLNAFTLKFILWKVYFKLNVNDVKNKILMIDVTAKTRAGAKKAFIIDRTHSARGKRRDENTRTPFKGNG